MCVVISCSVSAATCINISVSIVTVVIQYHDNGQWLLIEPSERVLASNHVSSQWWGTLYIDVVSTMGTCSTALHDMYVFPCAVHAADVLWLSSTYYCRMMAMSI